MDKRKALDEITKEIERCKICKIGSSGKAVAGEGNPNADVVFLGEAPGREEAKTGRPFIGRSGKYLRSLIRGIGLKEDDVYITSPVKYLPDRGTPTKKDIEHGMVHLSKQLDVIQPKLAVLLGKTSAYAIFCEDIPIMKVHGEVREKDRRNYFLTLHPAAAIRIQKFKPVIEGDFGKLKELLGKRGLLK